MASFSIYIYVCIIVGHYVQYSIQAAIYLCVYFTLILLSVWSLAVTRIVDVARVPHDYKVDEETDAALRACTPIENGQIILEKSTREQIDQQIKILERFCNAMDIVVAECDHVGRIKYCYECKHVKPDRCRHCSSCDRCVVKFDHHCPWINRCVSQSNYKYFLLYIFYSTITVIWFLLTSFEGVVRYFTNQEWDKEAGKFAAIILVGIPFAIFGYYPLGELLRFHWELIELNETTCEQAKPAILRFDNMADYTMGRAANLKKIFGWGLWFVPLPTDTEDGMHYEIRYVDPNNTSRFKRVEIDNEDAVETDREMTQQSD
ncbi:hypothetical protein WR25_13434 [Diploscapter pachys]|uniref:Palmitoyltransferase n=1 Tax=Diploscapter pachys TaxID=2018661 RepID=A0A2A2KGA8_9BILA|nr:hypothetical protein WR25_13434 [Diploscapter pachys]